MSSKPSDSSIDLLDAFSGGASGTGSTTQWNPTRCEFEFDEDSNLQFFGFEQAFPGGWSRQEYHWGMASTPIPEWMLMRLVAHALVNMLPDKGLQEAFESLSRMREFYAEPNLLPPVSEPGRVRARMSGRVERPTFQVDSE